MAFKSGSKHNFKDDLPYEEDKAAREQLCIELCAHLAEGYSFECFPKCEKTRLARLIEAFKEEFPHQALDKARQMGQYDWESIGKRQADGRCLGNSRSWFYNMANRYGWRDKVDLQADTKGSLSVQVVNYSSTHRDSASDTEPKVDGEGPER